MRQQTVGPFHSSQFLPLVFIPLWLSLVENLFFQKNPLQDLLSSLNSLISTNDKNGILTDHVIFKLRYNEIYQMKTTIHSFRRSRPHEMLLYGLTPHFIALPLSS